MTIKDSILARDVIGLSHFCWFLSVSPAVPTYLFYESLPHHTHARSPPSLHLSLPQSLAILLGPVHQKALQRLRYDSNQSYLFFFFLHMPSVVVHR